MKTDVPIELHYAENFKIPQIDIPFQRPMHFDNYDECQAWIIKQTTENKDAILQADIPTHTDVQFKYEGLIGKFTIFTLDENASEHEAHGLFFIARNGNKLKIYRTYNQNPADTREILDI